VRDHERRAGREFAAQGQREHVGGLADDLLQHLGDGAGEEFRRIAPITALRMTEAG
jgi:hypothetical protein